jgi:Flavodoxin reductases (ferredoxin-NADPH reductases) family 1
MTRTLLRLDRLLGRTSMYGLLLAVLTLLAAWALLGSLVGALPQSFVDLASSLAVCVGVAVGANCMIGSLVHAPRRHVSALSTGLLLFFLLWPSSSTVDVLAAAAAALVATASKYLLVVRGRRLVNPAAFGALVVAVVGIGAPVWWVATAWMLPVVLVGGALVLRRAGGGGVAVVVASVALVGTALRLVLSGSPMVSALTTAVVSYPLVFLALFMATEPLTLPPRRRQRGIVAVLMGVFVCLPVTAHLGSWAFTLGPEAGIVLANLVAAVLAGRGTAGDLEVVGVRRPAPHVAEVVLAPRRPLSFRAGQYVELTVPSAADVRGNRRVFSLTSPPGEAQGSRPLLRVAFRLPGRPSAFKAALVALPAGAVVRSEGIRGDFLLPEDPQVPVLMVARGIGVTPFLGQLADLRERGEARDVVLVHVVRDAGDAALVEHLRESDSGVAVLVVEEGEDREQRAEFGAGEFLACCPDLRSRRAYVSGAPGFVAHTREALMRAGAAGVVTDTFTGY